MEGGSNSVSNEQVQPVEQFSGDDINILVAWLCLAAMETSLHTREPIRDSQLSGEEWIREIVHGHSDRIYEAFRMERHVFLNLCDLMRVRGWLKDSRFVQIDEQVGIFLSVVTHNNSNKDLCERFQHSGETIGKYFNRVLKAMIKFSKEIIKPPSFDVIPQEILIDPSHKRYFKGCVGAMDGTHIDATVPVSQQIPFRGRSGRTTQNVLCICSFDMKFTFVYAGWEGSANDCRVLSAALENPQLQFPRPPPGRYYVVDSGYATLSGFLTPFKGDRYHLSEYRGNGGQPRTARELFNKKHSSLKNVIERSFGALKNRFTILRQMPPFTIRKQALVVIACCALHNYICDQDAMDRNFSIYGDPEYPCGPTELEVADDTLHDAPGINMLRTRIANKMARDHNMPEIS
ncbi:hypothetical protein ACJRO7_016420 [Eucalyptus globulus]|uniref:DDE Tnp4 domain-containing protein n=1 Tax=Eucalyptus globulus TaxID=34317 RepID=A0ABD3LH48_EUCGL